MKRLIIIGLALWGLSACSPQEQAEAAQSTVKLATAPVSTLGRFPKNASEEVPALCRIRAKHTAERTMPAMAIFS